MKIEQRTKKSKEVPVLSKEKTLASLIRGEKVLFASGGGSL
jgi:hypothetical protein